MTSGATTSLVLAWPTHPIHQLVATWPLPFDRALALLGQRIAEHRLLPLAEIDTTAVLAATGLHVPAVRQVLTFHPRYMRTILEGDPAAVVEAPLKLTMTAVNDSNTALRCADPTVTFGPYPTLTGLGSELHRVTIALLAQPV